MTAKRFNQAAFTIVELLVSMVLSALLLLALTMVFSNAKATFAIQDGLTRIQEDGRIAVDLVAEQVRLAGFRKPVWTDPLDGFAPLTAATANGSGSANDTLQVMYMDDLNCRDQRNTALDPETREAVALYKRVTFNVDNNQNLRWTCEYGAGPDSLAVEIDDQVIVDNVESFQLLYGIDTDFPPDFSINSWTTADQITPEATVCLQSQSLCERAGLINALQSGIPVAVKVGLLIASPQPVSQDKDDSTYAILDVAIAAADDQRMRKDYSTTVTLRNLTL